MEGKKDASNVMARMGCVEERRQLGQSEPREYVDCGRRGDASQRSVGSDWRTYSGDKRHCRVVRRVAALGADSTKEDGERRDGADEREMVFWLWCGCAERLAVNRAVAAHFRPCRLQKNPTPDRGDLRGWSTNLSRPTFCRQLSLRHQPARPSWRCLRHRALIYFERHRISSGGNSHETGPLAMAPSAFLQTTSDVHSRASLRRRFQGVTNQKVQRRSSICILIHITLGNK